MSHSTRREFMKQAAAAGLALCAAERVWQQVVCAAEATGRQPNVLFLLADDLGWGDLGCYGSPIGKTPNIDALAAGGLRFTNFYVSSPVCSPTRGAFTTGRYPARLEIHGHFATEEQNKRRGMPQFMDPDVPTVADQFKRAGYVTGHFGKWHLGTITPAEYGFDDFRVNVGGGDSGWPREGSFWQRSSELIANETIRFLEENRDKPFYANVWTFHPHAPLDPSEEQMAPYENWQERRISGKFTTPFEVFYGTVGEMDKQLGRVLDKLDELGLNDNTVVVFSSDNGPEDIHLRESAHSGIGSTGPFRGRKRSLYEGGIRTPFIVRWPGNTPAGAIDESTVLGGVDFLPSMCALAGVPVQAGLTSDIDGEDMSAALLGTPQTRVRPLKWDRRFRVLGDTIHKSPRMAIRDGDWKLLMNPDGSRIELYNLPADPIEVDNVAAQHPEIVERLRATLLEWNATLPESPIEPDAGALDYPWPAR